MEHFSDPNSIHPRADAVPSRMSRRLLDPNGFLLARAPIFGRHRQNPLARGDSETIRNDPKRGTSRCDSHGDQRNPVSTTFEEAEQHQARNNC